MEKIRDIFAQELKKKGLRNTDQRNAILNMLLDNAQSHLSTEEIYSLVKERFPDIGLATVYRTLLLLDEIGLIHKIDFDDGRSRYEIINREEKHLHHHLLCTVCGRIDEVKDDLLEKLEKQILEKNGFKVKNHNLKFYGTCKDCLEKEKKPD